MAGSFLIASGYVDIDVHGVGSATRNISSLITKLVAVGPAAGGAATVAAGALGSVTAAVVSAGAATGAFALAAKPQLQQVTDVTKLYEAAQKAAAEGASDAAEKQKAYEQALAKLPPATRATAVAFAGLKKDFKGWSDSLAGTTMPVFTKGIQGLRDLLPQLTPLVKTAGGAFSGFMDELKAGINSGGFHTFMVKLNEAAKESLPNLLTAGKEVFRGIGGVIEAFLPTAGDMSGKIAELAKRFGDWGQQLGESSEFKNFMTFVSQNGPKIVETLGNLATTGQKLWQAFSPLAAIQLTVLAQLTDFISQLPPPVILALAAAVVALKLAIMGFQIYAALTAPAMAPLIASTWAWTAALLANPLTWVIAGIIALVAAIVLIATKTTWFQQLWDAIWSRVTQAYDKYIKPFVDVAVAIFDWFYDHLVGHSVIPDLVKAIIMWLGKLFSWMKDISGKIKSALMAAWNAIYTWVVQKVTSLVNSIRSGFNNARSFLASIGNTIVSLVRNAFTRLVSTIAGQVSSAVSRVKSFKNSVVGFFSGAGSWLVSSGRKLIQGFINGIKNMAGNVKNAVKGVLQGARNLLPFSPAKEGPFSGRGWTAFSGASLMQGLATGIDNSAGLPYQSMSKALGGVSGATGVQPVAASSGGSVSLHIENLNLDGKWDLANPQQNREAAKLLVKNINDELRNYEKERR